ncbi:MAG: ribonuclease III [Pseudohongiellaceae bacterium]
MDKLARRLQHEFRDAALLRQALTHCSAGRHNNERLEFLGDAVLGLTVSELLFRRYPEASEGELSRIRAGLVQQSTLAAIARSLRIGEELVLGAGEIKSGGANRDSILADALEALISALYLDGGLQVCRDHIAAWFVPLLEGSTPVQQAKDAKTTLQEFLQARKLGLPVYTVVETRGKDHQQEFVVHCSVVLLRDPVTGTGVTRKEAEQQAAAAVLAQMERPA